jgi:NAD(P)-dependent dehydrogenase (short-subunit alcohol dehydrogenase family)
MPRVILVTGATGDIGRSLASCFAQRGTHFALCDQAPIATAVGLLDELTQLGAKAIYRSVDVASPDAVDAFVTEAVREFGRVDICLANAGIVERGSLVDLTVDAWRRTLEVNLTGAFLTAQAAARAMLADGRGGHIVFTGSWVQDQPRAGIGAYCVSKSGLKMLAKCLALELADQRIRVNLVAPGWIDAGLTARNLEAHPERRAGIEAQIPLGRLASADEVARTVRLLCSDDAGYVTGTSLLVDGGASLGAAVGAANLRK